MTGKLFPVRVKKKKDILITKANIFFFYEITCTDESFTVRPEMCIKKVKKAKTINKQSKAVMHRGTH